MNNYSLTLIPPTISATYDSTEFTIMPSWNSFEGTGTIKLQKFEDSNWITVTDSEQSMTDDTVAYTIDTNGTYRLSARRTYQGHTSEWANSSEIIVSEIVE